MSGPNSAPEIGQQNFRTPASFLAACRARFGLKEFVWDLACSAHDCVGTLGGYEHPEIDALAEDWSVISRAAPGGVCFLNPPFAQSGAFARKCAEAGAPPIVVLVPVAIGTRWWRDYVHRKAVVVGCGRLVFNNPDGTPVVGKNGKPQPINRDCAVLAYNLLPVGTEWYLLEDWKNWHLNLTPDTSGASLNK